MFNLALIGEKVFRDGSDPMLIEDLDGIVVEMNREAERAYGWSRGDLIGKPITTIVPPNRHDQARELLARCIAGEDVRNIEGLRITKQGLVIPVLVTLSLLKDENNEPLGIATNAADMSAFKASEKKLAQMSKVFQDGADPMLIEDLEGVVTEMNHEAERAYGWARDELIGKPIKTIVPPERHGQADALLMRCRDGKDVRNVEGLRVTRTGRVVPVLLTLSLLRDENGDPMGIASIAADISTLKQAESASAQMSKVFRDGSDPMLIEDLGGIVIEMNHEAERAYGWSRDELIGKPIKTIVPPDRHAQADELLVRCRSGEEIRNIEGVRVTRDGREIPVLLTLSLLRNEDGDPTSIATNAADITARKQAEADSARMSKVFQDGSVPMIIEDLDGIVIDMNQEAERAYGWSRDELIGKPIKTIVPKWRHHQADELLVRCRAGEEVRNIDGVRVDKGGLEKPILLTLSLLRDENGAPIGIASNAADITALKQAEAELLRHKEHLEELVTERTKKLEETHRYLEMALENMPGAMWVVDPELKFALLNDQYRALYGHDSDLAKAGNSVEPIIRHEIELGRMGDADFDETLRQRLDSFKTTGLEVFEDRGADGRYLHLLRRHAGDGFTVSVATDITELKIAELALEKAHDLITEGIGYASRIQRSLLPTPEALSEAFADYAVIWEPKDQVGGDIYLLRETPVGRMLMVADCTGHGVPGAFMTIIVTGAFDQALTETPLGKPAQLLTRINQIVKAILGQYDATSESDDGFECGLCLIERQTERITFAGARFELWSINGADISITKGDRAGIGYCRTDVDFPFTNQIIIVEEGDVFYLTSDGLIDQIGGPKRRSFGKRRLKQIILDYSRMSMAVQATHIQRAFEEYQHNEERRDDITLVGFQL